MKILKPEKLTLETPIHELHGLRTKARIFVKRDDLNGLLITGNKARKLEYLVADAKKKKCDTLVTCGPVQSNHCRTTAAFAKYFRFDCHLLLRIHDHRPRVYTGNLLLNQLLGAEVKYITHAQYQKRAQLLDEYAQVLTKKGKKPYIIPEGGSNEIGALGYVDCMREMSDFIHLQHVEAIYCAVGSGGTYAGLLLGKTLHNIKVDLNGIIVCDTIEYFNKTISEICRKAIVRFALPIEISDKDIQLIDGYKGEGYGIPYPDELRTITHIAKLGIILEPVYTGKAFYGMLQDLKKRKYKNVMFIHTGGIFSTFAYNREISKAIQ